MNHTHWISVTLDDSLTDNRVMQLVDTSFRLTEKKRR
jgi:predicted DNA-binding protein (MmcQ/YjbR family)